MNILRTEDLQKIPRERWTLLYHILDSLNRTCEHLGWDYFGADIKNESRCIATVRERDTQNEFEFEVVIDLVLSSPLEVQVVWANVPVRKTTDAQEQKAKFRSKLIAQLKHDLNGADTIEPLSKQQLLDVITAPLYAINSVTPPAINPQTTAQAEISSSTSKPKRSRRPRKEAIKRVALALYLQAHEKMTISGAIDKYGGDERTVSKYQDHPEVQSLVKSLREDETNREANKLKRWAIETKHRRNNFEADFAD